MRFVKGAQIWAADGEKIGTLSRVVIDAKTRDVTDLVVERSALPRTEKVIPIGLVDLEEEKQITLRETNQSVDDFPDYETTYYVPVDRIETPYENIQTSYWYPPTNLQSGGLIPGGLPDSVTRTESGIPEGRVAIAEGSQVISADEKHIGNVEQLIAQPKSNNVTHLVVGKGFLLKEHKLLPALWVSKVGENKVYLSVDADVFERLPDYQSNP